MATSIKTPDPAVDNLLADLEAKAKVAFPFFQTMAQRPEALKTFMPFYGAVAGPGSVDRRTKELVYLAVSFANNCALCSAAHVQSGKKAGLSDEDLAALRAGKDDRFTDSERAAIRYARELAKTAWARESLAGLRAHFNEEQVVEITLQASMANFTNRFNNAFSLQPGE